MSIPRLLCIGILCLMSYGIAGADSKTLYTPPFEFGVVQSPPNFQCCILNTSKREKEVTIQSILVGSTLVNSLDWVLSPEGGVCAGGFTGCTDGCLWFCKFIVEGSKHQYRAHALITEGQVPKLSIPAE